MRNTRVAVGRLIQWESRLGTGQAVISRIHKTLALALEISREPDFSYGTMWRVEIRLSLAGHGRKIGITHQFRPGRKQQKGKQ